VTLAKLSVGCPCQCRSCKLNEANANPLAIVPYEAKEKVDLGGDIVSQDCICCNDLSTVSYEFVCMFFLWNEFLMEMNFLWN